MIVNQLYLYNPWETASLWAYINPLIDMYLGTYIRKPGVHLHPATYEHTYASVWLK